MKNENAVETIAVRYSDLATGGNTRCESMSYLPMPFDKLYGQFLL